MAPGTSSEAQRIRRAFRRSVRALTRPSPGLGAFARDLLRYAAFAAAVALAHRHVAARSTLAGVPLYPLAAWLIGTRFRAVANMIHEASHGLLVDDPRWNRAVGHLLAVLDFTAFDVYTREHRSHHRHLGDPERDLDFATRARFGFGEHTPHALLLHGLRPLTLFHLPVFLKPVMHHRGDPRWVSAARLAYAALLGLAFAWEPRAFVLYYALPYVTAYQVIRYWSDAADHAQVLRKPDELDRSRNHVLPSALLNWIVMPRHDEYHLVHHLFPGVPTRDLRAVHQLLLGDAVYAARDHHFSAVLAGAATEAPR